MTSEFTIVIWNVEHGAAIYARTPNGRSIVLDAGASDTFSPGTWLSQRYKVKDVELFVLSHPDADHIRDIQNVKELLTPQTFMRNKTVPKEIIYPTYPPVTNPLKYYHDQVDSAYTGTLPDDSSLKLSPPSNWGGVQILAWYNHADTHKFSILNDYSVVTCLRYGNLVFLFPGDLEGPGWKALMDDKTFTDALAAGSKDQVRILVAAHHGRDTGVYKPFLDHFQPHLTVISDKYGVGYTAYPTYKAASKGLPVTDKAKSTTETRFVVSTKVNDFIRISSNGSSTAVFI